MKKIHLVWVSVIMVLAPALMAPTCSQLAVASNYVDPNRYSVTGGCTPRGVYQPGPPGEQSIDVEDVEAADDLDD